MRLGVEAALVDGLLVRGDVDIVDGRVAGYGLSSPNGRGVATAGFVDLQVNGFSGVDFLEADTEGYRHAGEALLETGVTAYLPTLITAPEEQLLAALRELPIESDGPRILGAHLEGPFLSALRLGIHPPASRRNPDLDLLERLLDAGPVQLVTLAPELPHADALIERLLRREIVVSCGHSDASAEDANTAFEIGRCRPPYCTPSPVFRSVSMPAYSGTTRAISSRSSSPDRHENRSARSGRTRAASSAKMRHSLFASPMRPTAIGGEYTMRRSVVVSVPPPSCS